MIFESEDIIGYCDYCKEEILAKKGFVFNKDRTYHLNCYHLLIDAPMEFEEDDDISNTDE